jgi:hypothetical protein
VALTEDDQSGLALTVEGLSEEEIQALLEGLERIAAAVGAEVMISDDGRAPIAVSDRPELQAHQVRDQARETGWTYGDGRVSVGTAHVGQHVTVKAEG